ncbi:hypothetical protein ACJ73_03143 [Blastomyces percursus]|uniref:Uncharacterized protein n=1 Tax=Blastomyces percursus TaxID=1658174 RepID=A0A1J9Q9K4_9EURO|nr:hypothetical protein ACJ73_03143 [Blastomyces percursus]
MDLIGLVMFSVSVALFGAFHEIPFTDIRPERSFPRRLYGGFRSGYVFGMLGEVLDIILPEGQPMVSQESLELLAPANLTACRSSVTLAQTAPTSTSTLRPVPIGAGNTPEPTMTRSIIDSRALIEISHFSHAERTGWLLKILRAFFLASKNIFIQTLVFIIHVSPVLLILRAVRICFPFAYNLYKWVVSKLVGRGILDELDDVVADSELYRSLLLSKMELLKISGETVALFQAADEAFQQRMATTTRTFNQRSGEVLEECALLKKAVHKMKSEYATWPTQDELLRDYVKNFKDSLTIAKDDLDNEIDRLKNLIPNFTEEFHKTVIRLDGNLLGSLPMVYLKERRLLESNIQTMHEAMSQLPSLKSLQSEAALAKKEMEDIRTQMRNLVTHGREALRDTACVFQEIDELKGKLRYLEDELALSRIALLSADTNEKGFHPLPEPSIVGLPAGLRNELVGETNNADDLGDGNHDTPHEPNESENGEESNYSPISSSPTQPQTSSDVLSSLLWEPVVFGATNNDIKRGRNIDADLASSVIFSLKYPPDKERAILWSSSQESDSEIEEEWKGGNVRSVRARGPANDARHRLPITEPSRARKARPNKRQRAKKRATRTAFIIRAPRETPVPAV